MTDSYVPIRTHYAQEYGTGKLVNPGGYHVRFTHEATKRPGPERHGCNQERYADEKAFICDGKVHDVHVGDRLHFGIAKDYVDDQGVAQQADHAD